MKKSILGLFLSWSLIMGNLQAEDSAFERGQNAFTIKDFKTALKYWLPLAKNGDKGAQHNVATMYYYGLGVEKDDKKAFKWFKELLSNNTNPDSNDQYFMGVMYFHAEGVAKNDKEAFSWILKSAKQGHTLAQRDIAGMYLDGVGTPVNYDEAFKWAKKSAEQGDENAQGLLGTFYRDGIGTNKNKELAIIWFEKSYKNGSEQAKEHLEALMNEK